MPSNSLQGAGRQLTRYELEIMDVVWRLGEVTVHDVCRGLSRPLAYTTVMTTLGILEGKKGCSGPRSAVAPMCTGHWCRATRCRVISLEDLRDVLFAGSLPSLVLNLVADESVSKSDVQALQEALRRMELSR